MKYFVLFFCVLVLLSSCVYSPTRIVTVSLYQDSPWETSTGKMLWYSLKYFDGKKVNTIYLEEGQRSIALPVSSSYLSIFALYPLGSLSPFGGFHDGGGKTEVFLYPEYGSFAAMLIDAAEARPEVVKEVRMEYVLQDYPDLLAVDRRKALESLYDGTWDKKAFSLSKRYAIPLDGVLTGRWSSLLSSSDSFVRKSVSQDQFLSLFPGVWYYLCLERKRMLTIVVSEEGEYWTKLQEEPIWY